MPSRTINNLGPEASRKRPRRVADDNSDDEVVDVQQASSGLRHDSRKRARTSLASSSKGSAQRTRDATPVSSGSEDDVQMGDGEESSDAVSPPKTQYEILRDNDFKHLEHEALDDQRATQTLRFRPSRIGENAVADNGIIESITCVNFMCHERLQCDIGPLLNFIVGENGSGKSAILTAITLCLGGKASSTNRGASLKNFIKEGRDRTILSIKIKNRGIDGYKQEIYGDSIIIERSFSRTGVSGFKVKSTTGQTISIKKQEVDDITEYYCLQVDNPLNVLSQDNARQFLNTATPIQKYKFFIEGVQLEQLDRDYRLVSEFLELGEEKVPLQRQRVEKAKREWEKAKRLSDTVHNHQNARRRLRLLTSQLAWSQVSDEERQLEERQQKILEVDAKISQTENTIERKAEDLAEHDEKILLAERAVEEIRREEEDIQAKLEHYQDKFWVARKQLDQLHTDERSAHSELKAASSKIAKLEEEIHKEERRLEKSNGDFLSRTRAELAGKKEKEQDMEREFEERRSQIPGVETKLQEVNRALQDIVKSIGEKRDEIKVAQSKIQRFQAGQGSQYDAYEPRLPRLLDMIASCNNFQNKPVGPLGAHIQLLDSVWSGILETTLGGALNNFVVTSLHDHKLLRGLMDRAGVKSCSILIGNSTPLNTAGKEPDPSFNTILRVLKFDNQLVRDQLIINSHIDQVLLIKNRLEAEQVMFDGTAPRNAVACLSLHDGKRGQGLRLTNRGGSNLGTTPVEPNPNLRPRMKMEASFQLSLMQESLQHLEEDLRELEGRKRRAQQDRQRFDRELSQLAGSMDSLKDSRSRALVEIERIECELDKYDNVDGRLRGFQEQLAQVSSDKDHHGRQFGELVVRTQSFNKEVETCKEQLDEAKTRMKEHEARAEKKIDKVRRFNQVRLILLTEKNQAHAELDMLKDDRVRAEEKRMRQAERLGDFVRMAEQVSPERVYIPDNETYQSVEKTHAALKTQIETAQKERGMSDAQVFELAIDTKAVYDRMCRDLQAIMDVNKGLKDTLTKRLHKWRTFQRYISAHSRANFIYLLSERGFRGKLMLDHKQKRLAIQVEPDKGEKRAGGRNTKTLSGGEKSFSSICLLLSIWEAMGSPLRCLDEFDVFMDNVNRAISTNMLISAARRSVGRQYILITPNAIEGRAALDKDVTLIRMRDPRQRSLNGY